MGKQADDPDYQGVNGCLHSGRRVICRFRQCLSTCSLLGNHSPMGDRCVAFEQGIDAIREVAGGEVAVARSYPPAVALARSRSPGRWGSACGNGSHSAGFIGLGTSPDKMMRWRRTVGSGTGAAESSDAE